MRAEDLVTVLKASEIVFRKPMIFESASDMVSVHSYPEEISDYLMGVDVEDLDEAFRLSIELWLYISARLTMFPSEEEFESVVDELAMKRVDGLCRYDAKNRKSALKCEACPIGREGEICFREVEKFLKREGSAFDVLRRLVEEYEKIRSSK